MFENLLSMYQPLADSLGMPVVYATALFIVLSVWEITWKFIGMWKAAQRKSLIWFICMGIFNTVGILPILYIYVFSKMKNKRKK